MSVSQSQAQLDLAQAAQAQPIRKAVIPAAGFGTRLFPATKAVKKELFPIIDRHGRAKPIILAIVEEALSAGIESVGIVVQPDDRPHVEAFFHDLPTGEYLAKLTEKYSADIHSLQEIGQRITFLSQPTQDGFGHAVFCANEWVGNEPFLLLLGDHVYISDTDISCAMQLINIFQQTGKSTIGLEVSPIEDITHRGCVTGVWQAPDSVLNITQLYEKPTVDYARQHLHVPDMPADQSLAVFGMYVLTPQIFDYLADHIQRNVRERGEFQLTSCLDRLRQEEGMMGYRVKGRSFDTGQPQSYRQAIIEFGAVNNNS